MSDVAASADTGLSKEEAGRELQGPLFPLAWGHGRLPEIRGFRQVPSRVQSPQNTPAIGLERASPEPTCSLHTQVGVA